MSTSDRFNILIVDPDPKSRSTLKDAALSLTSFNKVLFSKNIEEALQFGSGVDQIDVVTLSYRLTMEEISDFIKEVKKTSGGKRWAFITVLKSSDQQNEVIAENMLNGIDGFLFEPYSADNLREMAEVTAKVKFKNEQARLKGALEMYIREVSIHLDAVAFYAAQQRPSVIAKNKLTESCTKLKKFTKENWDIYTSVLSDVLTNVLPPEGIQYQGVSRRVRERMKAKMMKDLESQYKE
jgi:response regulator RpfG family c-di-GMP phosphodiesterase